MIFDFLLLSGELERARSKHCSAHPGRPTLLTTKEEEDLVQFLIEALVTYFFSGT